MSRIRNLMFVLFSIPFFMQIQAQGDSIKTGIVHDLSKSHFELKNFDKGKNNIDTSPIYFELDNEKLQSGRIILNLSTLKQEDINISWQNYSSKSSRARWVSKLQYRLSEDDDWKDVLDSRSRPYEFYTNRRRYTKNFSKAYLPKECNDKEFVQVSWKLYKIGGRGVNPQIKTRNIKVLSNTDPYMGLSAEITPIVHKGKEYEKVDKLIFNHIPLPYTYPETIRMRITGKHIRENVTLEISGKDKDVFSIDSKTTDITKTSKTVVVKYAPKKEGVHKAVLTINTKKLPNPIHIPLEGSCLNAVDFQKNLLSPDSVSSANVSYAAGVFSHKEYQFRLKIKDVDNSVESIEKGKIETGIKVKYRWLRDSEILFEMSDRVKTDSYCVPLQSPMTSNRLEIEIENPDRFTLTDLYFGLPKPRRVIKSGNWDDPEIWENRQRPTIEDVVYISDSCNVEVNTDVMCAMLVLGDKVNVDINTGKIFYISGDIIYGKQSYFTVHQYLIPNKWNYISSPVNKTKALIYSMIDDNNETWLMKYNTGVMSKHGDYWSEYLTDPNYDIEAARGYAVYTHKPLNVKYEGILCDSRTTFTLVTKNHDKWNLLGNPFTAPLSTKKLFEDVDGKIQGNAIFLLDRENKVYNPIIVDSNEDVMIPSLESFFVEAIRDGSEITFKRSHQYIPKTGRQSLVNHNYLNLSASVDGKTQYALMGMIDNASYDFDEYDAHKMFGTNEEMAEIYFLVGEQELSVNTFPGYPACFDVGLYIGQPAKTELSLNNLSVLPQNIVVLLEDKDEGRFYDMCKGENIVTDLKSGTTNDKYRIHLNKAINIYEIHPEYSGIYLWQDNGRILVYSDQINELQTIRLWDKNHNLVDEKTFGNKVVVFDKDMEPGRYTVDLNVEDKWITDFIVEIK